MTQLSPRLTRMLLNFVCSRKWTPYYHLPEYMERYWLLGADNVERNREKPGFAPRRRSWLYRWLTNRIAARLHHTLRSDRDRALHDHPSWNISIVLTGGYWEVCEPNELSKDMSAFYGYILEQLESSPGQPHIAAEWMNIRWRGPGSIVFLCLGSVLRRRQPGLQQRPQRVPRACRPQIAHLTIQSFKGASSEQSTVDRREP